MLSTCGSGRVRGSHMDLSVFKYMWRDINTSFLKMCGRYDRVSCSDNFNHKKVIIRGYRYEFSFEYKYIWRRKNVTIFVGRVDNLRKKIWELLYKNLQYLQENCMFFTKKFVKFCRKILTNFVRKVDNFYSKIWRYLQENLMIFSGKFDDFYRKIWQFA